MNLPDHIRISVAAVGGPDTEEGQEMMRILMEREPHVLQDDDGAVPVPKPLPPPPFPVPPVQEPEPAEAAILGPELDAMFQRVFAPVPAKDPQGE